MAHSGNILREGYTVMKPYTIETWNNLMNVHNYIQNQEKDLYYIRISITYAFCNYCYLTCFKHTIMQLFCFSMSFMSIVRSFYLIHPSLYDITLPRKSSLQNVPAIWRFIKPLSNGDNLTRSLFVHDSLEHWVWVNIKSNMQVTI